MKKIRIALVGIGKIACDQHVPALAGSDAFEVVAAASPHHRLEGVPNFASIEALLDAIPDLDAVAICTPPQLRYEIARYALQRGRHVLLEKPPGATLNEVAALIDLAERSNVALFAAWHSQEAAAVGPARRWLVDRKVRRVTVTWKEDVRVWHPGQAWIWKAGGLGVFDPGINALSILTRILPGTLVLKDAELAFPSNCETPIAASLKMTNEFGTEVGMELDFLQAGPPSWDIEIETDRGPLLLSKGGAVMRVGDAAPVAEPNDEYPNLYRRFEQLVRERRIDVDVAPFRLVADALMCGRRTLAEPFVE
ncbi:MAG TPA: Gfo/Idh/MocA family oxidoreductase [Woeseiaceae bacterium]|nr:Gfo/Idh/MocA family oxidoreductase [Woeseiaceae bacterium]